MTKRYFTVQRTITSQKSLHYHISIASSFFQCSRIPDRITAVCPNLPHMLERFLIYRYIVKPGFTVCFGYLANDLAGIAGCNVPGGNILCHHAACTDHCVIADVHPPAGSPNCRRSIRYDRWSHRYRIHKLCFWWQDARDDRPYKSLHWGPSGNYLRSPQEPRR